MNRRSFLTTAAVGSVAAPNALSRIPSRTKGLYPKPLQAWEFNQFGFPEEPYKVLTLKPGEWAFCVRKPRGAVVIKRGKGRVMYCLTHSSQPRILIANWLSPTLRIWAIGIEGGARVLPGEVLPILSASGSYFWDNTRFVKWSMPTVETGD